VLGDVHEGWTVAITTLMNERVAIGSGGGGGGRGTVHDLIDLARRRGMNTDPILRPRLADLYERGHGRKLLAGVDVSALMIDDARRRLEKSVTPGTDVALQVCSAVALPFPDASFDLVMANAMTKHLDDEPFAAFLAEARRVLVPGGRISVWDFGRPLFKLPDVTPKNAALELKNLRTSDDEVEALLAAGFIQAAPYTLKRPWRMPVTLEGAVGTRQ
jgi:SAM-dependent methyltransferase